MKSLFLMSLALAAGFAVAQAEPGALAIDAPSEGEISTEYNIDQILTRYLEKTKKTRGKNYRSDGSFFYVQCGTGTIAAPTTHRSYNESRVRAFEKAMLQAKSDLAKMLQVDLGSAAIYKSVEHAPSPEASLEAQVAQALAALPDESVCGKVVSLIHKKLDNALAKEGYDASQAKADYAAAKARMDSLVSSTNFQRDAAAAASMMLSGVQAFYTVEVQNKTGNGEIGVVAIWSPALADMAASLTDGRSVANKAPKQPIIQQIPSDPKVLLSTFGVQQKINERGELVLVSFGQAAALTKSTDSKQNAYRKAALLAQVQIRNFAGEAVRMEENRQEAETTEDFENAELPNYLDESSYQTFQKTVAAKMTCNGIQELTRWSAVHPISGKPVYGVICTWSPQSADEARRVKALIESTARDGALGRRTVPGTAAAPAGAPVQRPVSKGNPGSSLLNSGAEGDDDAF